MFSSSTWMSSTLSLVSILGICPPQILGAYLITDRVVVRDTFLDGKSIGRMKVLVTMMSNTYGLQKSIGRGWVLLVLILCLLCHLCTPQEFVYCHSGFCYSSLEILRSASPSVRFTLCQKWGHPVSLLWLSLQRRQIQDVGSLASLCSPESTMPRSSSG